MRTLESNPPRVLLAALMLVAAACGVVQGARDGDTAAQVLARQCPSQTACAQSLVTAWQAGDRDTASVIATPGVVTDLFDSDYDPSMDWQPAYLDAGEACPTSGGNDQATCYFTDPASKLGPVLTITVDWVGGAPRPAGPIGEIAFSYLPPNAE